MAQVAGGIGVGVVWDAPWDLGALAVEGTPYMQSYRLLECFADQAACVEQETQEGEQMHAVIGDLGSRWLRGGALSTGLLTGDATIGDLWDHGYAMGDDYIWGDMVDAYQAGEYFQGGRHTGNLTTDTALTVVPGGAAVRAATATRRIDNLPGPGAGASSPTVGAINTVDNIPAVNWGQQAKHFPGHQNYVTGRSQLTSNPEVLFQRAGAGTPVGNVPRGQAGFRERIDFGDTIGTYIARDGSSSSTSIGILHYRADGSAHIVPGRP